MAPLRVVSPTLGDARAPSQCSFCSRCTVVASRFNTWVRPNFVSFPSLRGWLFQRIPRVGRDLQACSCVRFVLCDACRIENVGRFNYYCFFCGKLPFRGLPRFGDYLVPVFRMLFRY